MQQFKKRACQSTHWLSATQYGREAAEGFSTLLESNPSHQTICCSLASVYWKNSILVVILLKCFTICFFACRGPFLGQITFHLRPIGLQTLVAINSESRLTSFPSLCTLIFEVAVLFDSNLSRRPFLRQVVDLDLLLCTGFD